MYFSKSRLFTLSAIISLLFLVSSKTLSNAKEIVGVSEFAQINSSSHILEKRNLTSQTINIPREFVPQKISISKKQITLYFVKDALSRFINPELSKYSGNFLKDTKFNKAGINNLRFELIREVFDSCGSRGNCIVGTGNSPTRGGIRLYGDWYYNHRELLAKNPFTGKEHFSPWAEVRGTAEVPVYFWINQGVVNITTGAPTIRGSNFLGEIGSLVANWVPKVADSIQGNAMLSFTQDLKPIAIDEAAKYLADQRIIDATMSHQILSQNFPQLNLVVTDEKLIAVSIKIK